MKKKASDPKTPVPVQQLITVRRREGMTRVEISLAIGFDPAEIGKDRERVIYEGLGKMLAGLLTPEGIQEFRARFDAALKEKGQA